MNNQSTAIFNRPKMEQNHLARIFFKKTKQLENGVQMQDAALQTIRRKILEIRGNPALPSEKKIPTIFEFPPAKVPQISKSPKRRRNYSSRFFF
jgi:hypothetical protein